jgi:hypothetical protein
LFVDRKPMPGRGGDAFQGAHVCLGAVILKTGDLAFTGVPAVWSARPA